MLRVLRATAQAVLVAQRPRACVTGFSNSGGSRGMGADQSVPAAARSTATTASATAPVEKTDCGECKGCSEHTKCLVGTVSEHGRHVIVSTGTRSHPGLLAC